MTRIGNRDYPNYLPLPTLELREERKSTRANTDVLLAWLRISGVLIEQEPIRTVRGYTPRLRHVASLHLAQKSFSVIHSKAAYVSVSGETTAWINTGNLTDSDLRLPSQNSSMGMNNVIMRTNGRAAAFIMQAVKRGFGVVAGSHSFGESVKMVYDIGNTGEPARLPTILSEALLAIDPRRDHRVADPLDHAPSEPKAIALISQYAPNGILANALAYAGDRGTYVSVPSQPDCDHRAKSFPYNINNKIFQLRDIGNGEQRTVPSHTKALLVTYHDRTAKVIFGTDNFVTNLQKILRNEELATVVSLNLKNADDAAYFAELTTLMKDIGEINQETAEQLLSY